MTVKVTMNFVWSDTGRRNYGATESHYLLLDPSSLDDAFDPYIKDLAAARIELCAGNVTLTEVRASRIVQRGQSFRGAKRTKIGYTSVDPELNKYGIQGYPITFKDTNADQPNAALYVDGTTTDNEQAKSRTYLLGLPDDLLGTNPPGPRLNQVPGWAGKFNLWVNELTDNPWGFKARVLNPPQFPTPILAWDNEAAETSRLTFQVDAANDVGGEGSVVQIRGVSMLSPLYPRPNGQFRVASVTTEGDVSTYTLRSTEGFIAGQIDEPGTAEPVQMAFFPYSDLQLAGQGTRKRGVGSVRPRGRSRGRSRRLVL